MKKQTIGFNERVQSKLSHIDFKTKPECSNTSWQSTHTKCRNGPYPQTQSKIHRFQVPDDKVSWKVSWSEYNPVKYTAQHILKQPWADPEIGNPVGRTGISGRGLLGRWGPNHAADPIVTRYSMWKRDADGNIIKDEISNTPLMFCSEGFPCPCRYFLMLNDPIIPGIGIPVDSEDLLIDEHFSWTTPLLQGMVDPGEKVSQTLKREFSEEALNSLCLKDEEKKIIENIINIFFDNGTVAVKKGNTTN
ncbi:ADP-ribose pyrophosphatase, mitochondrial [Nymphon striatum]|nr:ADP-ribose pyrophosphatase, mitochondrial [Nymphon striatum]